MRAFDLAVTDSKHSSCSRNADGWEMEMPSQKFQHDGVLHNKDKCVALSGKHKDGPSTPLGTGGTAKPGA